jgi:MFS family permease
MLNSENSTSVLVVEDDIPKEDAFPEGGYGWIIVIASFLIHIPTIGVPTCFGVFQEHYKNESVFPGSYSTLSIAFIGSFGTAGIGIFALISGRLTDLFGHRLMAVIGGIIQFASLMLASFSQQYWQFLLLQGVLFGLGCAISYFPALTLISHWFDKKKGTATGIAVSGAGMGGLVVAPVIRSLISSIGIPGTLRALAAFCGIVTILSGLTLKSLRAKSSQKPMDYRKILKDVRFIKLFVMAAFSSTGYFIPFFFAPTFAVYYGMSKSQGALVVGFLNAASGLGRIVLGFNADLLGHLNSLLLSIVIAGLSVLLVWPFATTFGTLVFFGIIYGFFIGGFISLLPTAIVQLFGLENIATITGMVYSGVFFGNLFGSPFAGALLDALTTNNPDGTTTINFVPMIFLGGVPILIGASIVFSIRWSAAKGVLFVKI